MRHPAAVQVPGRAAALDPGTDSTSVSLERAPHRAGPGAGVRDIWLVRPSRSGVGSARRCTARADAPPPGGLPTRARPRALCPAHCLPVHRICAEAPGRRFSPRTGERR